MSGPAPIAFVLCSHNPEPRCLQRSVASLQLLLIRHPAVECVLVDNCSDPPLAGAAPVKALRMAHSQARLVVEPRQGLCWARQAGITATTAPWVLFVDDDNELAPDYIEGLLDAISRFQDVAAWGPGRLDVEFLDPVPPEVAAHPEWFQQRSRPLAYGCQPATWQAHYPNGSGFAIRRDVLESYTARLAAGELTATGRSGTSMASAEDIQMVWEAIRRGSAAGMHPGLRLHHLIPAGKTSMRALSRHSFGTSSSYYPALVESWPEESRNLPPVPSEATVVKRLMRLILKRQLRPAQRFQASCDLAVHLGFACGLSAVHGDPRYARYVAWAELLGLT